MQKDIEGRYQSNIQSLLYVGTCHRGESVLPNNPKVMGLPSFAGAIASFIFAGFISFGVA